MPIYHIPENNPDGNIHPLTVDDIASVLKFMAILGFLLGMAVATLLHKYMFHPLGY